MQSGIMAGVNAGFSQIGSFNEQGLSEREQEQRRKIILKQGRRAEYQQINQDARTLAEQNNIAGASGIVGGRDSALAIFNDSVRKLEQNAANIMYQAKLEAGPPPEKPSTFEMIDMGTNMTGRYPFGPAGTLLPYYLGRSGVRMPHLPSLSGDQRNSLAKGGQSLLSQMAARRNAAIDARNDYMVRNMPQDDEEDDYLKQNPWSSSYYGGGYT